MSGQPGAMSGHPRPGSGGATNAEPVTPPSTDAAVLSVEAGAIPPTETASTSVAVPEAGTTAIPAPEPAAATATDAATAGAIAPVRRPRRLAVVAGLTRLLRFAAMLALLTVGGAIGYQSFLTSQPAPTGPVADPATAGNLPAPVVREFSWANRPRH